MNKTFAVMEAYTAVVLMILAISSMAMGYGKDRIKKNYVRVIWTHIFLLFSDALTWILPQYPNFLWLYKALLPIIYILTLIGLGFFHCFLIDFLSKRDRISPHWKKIPIPYVIVSGILWTSSAWTGWFYSFTEAGELVYGPYHAISQGIAAFFIAMDILIILAHSFKLETAELVVWLSYGMLPALAIPLELEFDAMPAYLAAALSLIIMFVMMLYEQNCKVKKQAIRVREKQLNMMLDQLQPQLIAGSVRAIANVCDSNPDTARELLIRYADYLDKSLVDINRNAYVPFEEELRQVRTFLSIEKLLYGENVHIAYDISVTNFRMPPLLLSILVENAMHNELDYSVGGTIMLSTKEYTDRYVIIVDTHGAGDREAKNISYPFLGELEQRITLLDDVSLSYSKDFFVHKPVVLSIRKDKAKMIAESVWK